MRTLPTLKPCKNNTCIYHLGTVSHAKSRKYKFLVQISFLTFQDPFLAICKVDPNLLVGPPILQWSRLCLRELCEAFLCQSSDYKHLVCPKGKGLQ